MQTKREWTTIREYEDILFEYYNGIARITINRERYRNAFTPTTTAEMSDALRICREEADIDVIVITGAGDKAFCSGGDQNVKGRGGYIGKDGVPRLSVLDVQKQIRSIPKPVIAAVNGFQNHRKFSARSHVGVNFGNIIGFCSFRLSGFGKRRARKPKRKREGKRENDS